MQEFLQVNTIFFTVIGYPMSYIEFFGTILNLLCVWLVAKNHILNWPIGIAGTILFAFLFFQINLYADFLEQIYFLITGFWGWWTWTTYKNISSREKPIERMSHDNRLRWCFIAITGTVLLGYLTAHLHLYLPAFFKEAASFPYLDSFTTVLSFIATVFLVRKQFEAWFLWIIVDIVGIALYWAKDVRLISLLYVLFLILATKGLVNWLRLYKKQQTPLLKTL